MPKTWQQIFADTAIPDTTEISIGTEKVTIGELRSENARMNGEVAKEMQRATQMQTALEQDQIKAAELLAQLAVTPRAAPAAAPAAAAASNEPDYLSDPILRPLAQKLEAIAAENAKLRESFTTELTGLKNQVQMAASSYINDDWQRNFNSMPERSDPVLKPILDKVTLQSALKYAGDHRIVDHRNVPDPVRAARQMTETDRISAVQAAAREAGKQEGINLGRQQLAAEMPKPGVTGRRVVESPHKNMDQAIAALANDPEIQQQLAGIQRVQ